MIDTVSSKCYIVEKDKIAHNIRKLRQYLRSGKIYAVLKADGYGLGCRKMAAICSKNGVRRFAVGDLKGAQDVIASGAAVDELLLMTSAHPSEIPLLMQLGVTFTVASEDDAKHLIPYAAQAHIKVDVGMGRRGFLADERESIAALYHKYPQLRFTGIYTHFSDGMNTRKTNEQFHRFKAVLQTLDAAGIHPGTRHCCSSASIFRRDDMLLDGIRVGTALLGRLINSERIGLQRTGICQVPVESVKQLPKGSSIGYGSVFRARREMTVALCPIGTHNGFGIIGQNGAQQPIWSGLQLLSQLHNRMNNSGLPHGMIRNNRCRVLGRICSEMVILDVTDIPCRVGDIAQFEINPIFLHDMPIVFV